ncbi:hypothetical protein [Microbacterium sp.]|uniref:hypothetical protein n=1 Tax=Microbacterium sp. TaxID=51671 RepID=UPI003F9EB9BF
MDFWPTPANMVCALGPGDGVIDIRTPGEYERWHGFQGLPRDGLSCLDCLGAVNPRMLPKKITAARPILVHSPRPDGANAVDKCESVKSTQRGAGWKKLLKNLIAEYLHQFGYEVEVDPVTDGERIDLLTHAGSRRIAIRVELDKLKVDDFKAARRQLARQEMNTEVLWITFGCSWVDTANAVGIRFLEEPPTRGVIDVGGVFPVVDAGVFTFGTRGLTPAKPFGLGYFLERFMEGGVQNHPIAGERRGWAGTNAWDQHIRHLVRTREAAEQQQTQLEQELTEARRVHQEKIRGLELTAAAAASRAARAESETVRERERIAVATDERDSEIAHRTAATTWGAGVENLRDTNIVSRLGLRRHPAFVYPQPIEASNPKSASNWRQLLRAASPWALAVATMVLPLLSITYLAGTNTLAPLGDLWSAAMLICLGLLPAGVALWTDGRWCWALDNHSKLRGHRRAGRFLHRCGQREHSLNLFDAWLLFCIVESVTFVAWIVLHFS